MILNSRPRLLRLFRIKVQNVLCQDIQAHEQKRQGFGMSLFGNQVAQAHWQHWRLALLGTLPICRHERASTDSPVSGVAVI